MAKVQKIKKEKKFFRREFIPVFIAAGVLAILVLGLLYFLNNEPYTEEEKKLENTLNVEEVAIGSASDYCEGYEINDLRDAANKVYLTYGIEENVLLGEADITEEKDDHPDITSGEIYGEALRINVFGLSKDIKVKIMEHDSKGKVVLEYEFQIDPENENKEFYYVKPFAVGLADTTVRVYASDPVCNNLLLREFDTVIPKRNEFADYLVCSYEEYASMKECQKYILEDLDYERTYDKLEKLLIDKKNKDKNDKKEEDKKGNIFSDKKIYIIAGVSIVVVIAVVIVVIKRRKSND